MNGLAVAVSAANTDCHTKEVLWYIGKFFVCMAGEGAGTLMILTGGYNLNILL